MQDPGSSAGGAEGPHVAPPSGELLGALRDLYRAYQKTSIYPEDHPSIPAALRAAAEGFDGALDAAQTVTVAVEGERLVIDERPLDDPSGALRALALLLHDMELVSIEFRGGVQAEELHLLLRELGRARRERLRGPELARGVEREALPHVQIRAVDYGALCFDEGVRAPGEMPDEAALLRELSRQLAEASECTEAPAELADRLTRRIEDQEGAGVGLLRERLEQESRRLAEEPPERRAAARKRMAQFIAALSRRLRVDLLRVDPADPAESLATITELADVMPETDLIEALQEIDRHGARVPGSMLTLMNKLLRLAPARPGLDAGLQDTLARWGLPGAMLRADSVELREALGEVFRRRHKTEFNPVPYQGLLDDLSRRVLAGRGHPTLSRYRDPRDPADVRVHLGEVATLLLRGAGGAPYRPALLAQVASATDLLLQRGRIETVQDAVACARACSADADEPENTKQAARAFLESFGDERRIALVLEHGIVGDTVTDAALALLGLGGVTALGQVFTLLSTEPPARVAEPLVHWAVGRGAADLARVIGWRRTRGHAALRPMLSVLRRLEPAEALPLIEDLCDNEDARVRREALTLLCDLPVQGGPPVARLRRALRDEEVALTAVQLLGRAGTPAALDSLADVLAGAGGTAVWRELALRSTQTLLRHGTEGEERLCRVLDGPGRRLRPRALELGRLLAVLLAPRAGNPRVRAALRSWRRSAAGWASLLLPRRRHAAEGEPA